MKVSGLQVNAYACKNTDSELLYRHLADYGDYLAEECVDFRTKASALKEQLPDVNMFKLGTGSETIRFRR